MRLPACDPPKTRFETLPADAVEDCFKPPEKPLQVRCMHCDNEYSSDRIVWYRGLWCCPHIACGGAGFGFDIFPVDDPMWRPARRR